ncbi:hypothetical protein [Vibrio quintilis]|uniref:Uncharacterized protein n=1 Tax=Vibrio quintilis TaxID=1117707 RepID=A0A1M7YV05_9VIBR|nr:hypothetical protein [Vibrio quintilis]SHO56393.1 hypothetical protein VQ7734_02162 [Vibrio quintilis]
MKRSSSTYRLQMIKEVAMKKQDALSTTSQDPMADYIHQLLMEKPATKKNKDINLNFSGVHFDERAGGWISDQWSIKN